MKQMVNDRAWEIDGRRQRKMLRQLTEIIESMHSESSNLNHVTSRKLLLLASELGSVKKTLSSM